MRKGIMQGRLLPPIDGAIQRFPRDQWEKEFPLAVEAGVASIEWIYEVYGADSNPIGSDEGIKQIREISDRFNVTVGSLCADYFMDKPFLRVAVTEREQRIEVLRWLIDRCGKLGINRVILPFVDASKIDSSAERGEVVAILEAVLTNAEAARVELHLETSLPPAEFAELLARVPHSYVKVNYDSGNSASLGYDAAEEFGAYADRIGSVHIKDRTRGGGTVPLGTGAADFDKLFRLLRRVGYDRGFVLQVARGESGHEVAWATQNRVLVEELWANSVAT